MKAGTIFKTAALATALTFSGAANSAIFFDVNGAAPGGAVDLNLFDWFPDNGLLDGAIPIPNAPSTVTFDYRFQGRLNLSALTPGTEVTFQAVVPMTATVLATGGGISLAVDSILAGGTFDIYFDSTADANDITGLGYGLGDGIHILHGDVLASLASDQLGSIIISGTNAGLLDQFGVDNQNGVTTVGISGNIPLMRIEIEPDAGSTNANVVAMGFDLDFFPADVNGDTIDVPDDGDPTTLDHDLQFSSDNLAQFENANPSDQVVGVTPDYGADGVNDNTCGGAGVCDLHVESDGRSPFRATLQVPEPAGLALFGLGLLTMGAMRLSRKS